jgi:hypothetical protein
MTTHGFDDPLPANAPFVRGHQRQERLQRRLQVCATLVADESKRFGQPFFVAPQSFQGPLFA